MFEALMLARLGSRLLAAIGWRPVRAGRRSGCDREQRGQDLIEYGGILILVAAIITALLATGIVGDVANFVKSAVNGIIGSSAVSNANKTG